MSNPKPKLFELIQSMTRTEKRYFMIYANRHKIGSENNYMALFNIISELKVYEEDVVLRKYESRIKKEGANLAADKNYLYKNILQSLNEFHKGKSPNLEVKEHLHKAEILFNKELYKHCLTELKKAKKKADVNELHSLSAESSVWMSKCLIQLGEYELLNNHISHASESLALLDNYHAYARLYYQMIQLSHQYNFCRSEKHLKEVQKFMEHPFLEDEAIPLTLGAKIFFHRIHALCFRLYSDKKRESEAYQTILELMQSDIAFLEGHVKDYVEILHEQLPFLAKKGKEVFDHFLDTYYSSSTKLSKQHKTYLSAIGELVKLYFELEWTISIRDEEKLIAQLLHFRKKLESKRELLTKTLASRYDFLLICALRSLGEVHQMQKEARRFLLLYELDHCPELYFSAIVFLLQAHFEIQEAIGEYEYDRYKEKIKLLRSSIKKFPYQPAYVRFTYELFKEIPFNQKGNLNPYFVEKQRDCKQLLLKNPWLEGQLPYVCLLQWLEKRTEA